MNKQSLLLYVNKKHEKKLAPEFRVGDSVRVHVRIIEGANSRVQVFEGVVICFKGSDNTRTFTVRKISFGVGVERIFPISSPALDKIEVTRSGHVRRAKLYFLRDRVGKSSRLEEIERRPSPQSNENKNKKEAVPSKEAVSALVTATQG